MLELTRKLKKKSVQYKTAVLYRKSCTKYNPNFHIETIDAWLVLPWEKEMFEQLEKERQIYSNLF